MFFVAAKILVRIQNKLKSCGAAFFKGLVSLGGYFADGGGSQSFAGVKLFSVAM